MFYLTSTWHYRVLLSKFLILWLVSLRKESFFCQLIVFPSCARSFSCTSTPHDCMISMKYLFNHCNFRPLFTVKIWQGLAFGNYFGCVTQDPAFQAAASVYRKWCVMWTYKMPTMWKWLSLLCLLVRMCCCFSVVLQYRRSSTLWNVQKMYSARSCRKSRKELLLSRSHSAKAQCFSFPWRLPVLWPMIAR